MWSQPHDLIASATQVLGLEVCPTIVGLTVGSGLKVESLDYRLEMTDVCTLTCAIVAPVILTTLVPDTVVQVRVGPLESVLSISVFVTDTSGQVTSQTSTLISSPPIQCGSSVYLI